MVRMMGPMQIRLAALTVERWIIPEGKGKDIARVLLPLPDRHGMGADEN